MSDYRYLDDELNEREDLQIGFLFSFKSMFNAINLCEEKVKNPTDKHPRDCFRVIWMSAMFMMLIFIVATYKLFAIATIPFLCFYGAVFFKLRGAYKEFHYKTLSLTLSTIFGLLIEIGINIVLQIFVW